MSRQNENRYKHPEIHASALCTGLLSDMPLSSGMWAPVRIKTLTILDLPRWQKTCIIDIRENVHPTIGHASFYVVPHHLKWWSNLDKCWKPRIGLQYIQTIPQPGEEPTPDQLEDARSAIKTELGRLDDTIRAAYACPDGYGWQAIHSVGDFEQAKGFGADKNPVWSVRVLCGAIILPINYSPEKAAADESAKLVQNTDEKKPPFKAW